MAIKIVVAARDSAILTFSSPVVVPARGAAVRSFTDAVNSGDVQSDVANHPDDFELWQLATFDDMTGLFENCLEVLVRGKDVIRPKDAIRPKE